MKPTAIGLAALLIAALCACSAQPAEDSTSLQVSGSVTSESALADRGNGAVHPAEAVIAQYRKAEEVYAWFAATMMPVDSIDMIQGTEGDAYGHYYRVTVDGVRSLKSLRSYLEQVFTPEFAAQILKENEERFKEIAVGVDTVLYVGEAERSSDATKGLSEVSAFENEDGTWTVRVVTEDLDIEDETSATPPVIGHTTQEFLCKWVEDGWKFDSFELAW